MGNHSFFFGTIHKQLHDHVQFLLSKGFKIQELKPTDEYVRCEAAGQEPGHRGKLVYRSKIIYLENNIICVSTWYRGCGADKGRHTTYGKGSDSEMKENILNEKRLNQEFKILEDHIEAARKAYGFWEHSLKEGQSGYLERKGVGAHGIRFRNSDEYGNCAVVPLRDSNNKLWNYQLLTDAEKGNKIFARHGRTYGLFHQLAPLDNKRIIGIAESYVTAATVQQLTNIPMASAFYAGNLSPVAKEIRKLYPDAIIAIFADNDWHLKENEGLKKARIAMGEAGGNSCVVLPRFTDTTPAKNKTDWNDLYLSEGKEAVVTQIREQILPLYQMVRQNIRIK